MTVGAAGDPDLYFGCFRSSRLVLAGPATIARGLPSIVQLGYLLSRIFHVCGMGAGRRRGETEVLVTDVWPRHREDNVSGLDDRPPERRPHEHPVASGCGPRRERLVAVEEGKETV